MANTLLIIDAMNLIRRIFAVQQQQQATMNATLMATNTGVVNAVKKSLKQVPSSHVVAVFDGGEPSWRQQIYPEYKAGRTPAPQELLDNLDKLQDLLWHQGIDSLLSNNDEADDLIATLNATLKKNHRKTTIVSTDKGFYQLLCPYTQQYDYFNQVITRHTDVPKIMAIPCCQLHDYWALTGITSSNIKGVVGVGPKTAKSLLLEFGSLEKILNSKDEKNKALRKVQAQRQQALLAKKLVSLDLAIQLGFSLKELRYAGPR